MTTYTLKDYRDMLESRGILAGSELKEPETPVFSLSFDSRDVTPGTLFIAKGLHFREEYLESARVSGAICYVAERKIGDSFANRMIVSDMREAMACLAKMFYCDPLSSLESFAVTGTKGKTTSVTFLKYILDLDAERSGGKPAGLSCSVDIFDGREHIEPVNTTPEAPDLWKYMASARDCGLARFAVEVSSQAIKYKRTAGMTFDVACLTNVGYDHIGPAEHPDFEDYFTTKLKIFDSCRKACVNIDDPLSGRMLEYIGGRVPVVTFGTGEGADVRLSDVSREGGRSVFTITFGGRPCRMSITMPGMFNVTNALYAAAMAYAAGISPETVRDAVADARVKGRMLKYGSADGKLTILIDYAHNGMSFSALFDSLDTEYPGIRRVIIYGWHGNKGENRRHDIGVVTGGRADLTVITEKDSADEPFEKIADEVKHWITSAGGKCVVIRDRECALRAAVCADLSDSPRKTDGDPDPERRVVVFAGRGEEDWQKWGGSYYRWPTDPEMTEKIIAEYDSVHPVN